MTTRRDVIAAAALLAPLSLALKAARADEGKNEGSQTPKMADFLFVQNARGVAYADGTLTLKGVSPATVMFSDRPERIAGHMLTKRFVPFWSEGNEQPRVFRESGARDAWNQLVEIGVTRRLPGLGRGHYRLTPWHNSTAGEGGFEGLYED